MSLSPRFGVLSARTTSRATTWRLRDLLRRRRPRVHRTRIRGAATGKRHSVFRRRAHRRSRWAHRRLGARCWLGTHRRLRTRCGLGAPTSRRAHICRRMSTSRTSTDRTPTHRRMTIMMPIAPPIRAVVVIRRRWRGHVVYHRSADVRRSRHRRYVCRGRCIYRLCRVNRRSGGCGSVGRCGVHGIIHVNTARHEHANRRCGEQRDYFVLHCLTSF